MRIIFFIIVFVVGLILFVRYLESTSLFYPAKKIATTPASIGLLYEDVHFQTQDGFTLNGWFIKGELPVTLVFMHGNAGNIGDRLAKIDLFHHLGLNIFIFDYRGYGQSQGAPTEVGIYKDAVAAYDYLQTRKDIDKNKIILYGASLGGAVAVDLAVKRKVAGLIVDSTFTNGRDMAKRIYPFIPSFIVGIKLDSLAKIDAVTIPKLFLHSHEDEMVPYELGWKLYEAAPSPKMFIETEGGHNDTLIHDTSKFRQGLKDFLVKFNLI